MEYFLYIILFLSFLLLIIKMRKLRHKHNLTHAVDDFSKAKKSLSEGDLKVASQYCARALKLFNKTKSISKEAECYLFLGVLYRFSGAYDDSEYMFYTARELFQKENMADKIVETEGNLGMLLSLQERFDEAEGAFERALKVDSENKDILNQLALSNLLQSKHGRASKFVDSIKDKNGLSYDILSRLDLEKQNFEEALKHAQKASKIYKKENNISAFLESEYLQATILFKQELVSKSESKLKSLLKVSKESSGCFHEASAYNMLGLLHMQKQSFSKAKEFFNLSIELEQKNKRFSCLVEDYVNLGLLEKELNNQKASKENFEKALKYAKEYDRKDLVILIEEKLTNR